METKKISFGFSKTKKVEKPLVVEKKDYIECVEEKSIKVVGGDEVTETAPLIIPMKPNTLITTERLKQIAEEVEKGVENDQELIENKPIEEIVKKPPVNETLDEMAVRELLEESKKQVKVDTKSLTITVPPKSLADGEKESTLDDYESVPVQDFGLAMLRGMGWQPSKQVKHKQPVLRPKGLGLGADKVIKENQKKNAKDGKKDEELTIVKNAFVKITSGKYSGCYGKVVSLDEDNGRVVVDVSVKKETVSLSEFMMQPVTRAEFDKQSKVINAESYEEYKNKGVVSHKSRNNSPKADREPSSSTRNEREGKVTEDRSNRKEDIVDDRSTRRDYSNGKSKEKERHRRRSSSSDDRTKRREKNRYSSNESLDSIDSDKKSKYKSSKKYSSSESEEDRKHKRSKSDGKRDIDKKRKGKKKKRDRDRSPHYRKHRK